ncbi:MAG: hypothetical protein COB00_07355 [Alcanivorax sp.]|nr:MAG: hypothetical protein COB00_07355 [Alcanivorax sp.]
MTNKYIKTPLVSIVTPYYRSLSTIISTIDSVRAQEVGDWEMLIVDDNSEDNIEALIIERYPTDHRIKYLKNCNKKGAAGARNTGIQAATGKYIAFLDSDDLWAPEKLTNQVKFMKENNLVFSFGNYFSFKSLKADGKPSVAGSFIAPSKLTFDDLCKTCSIGCLTVMIDKERAPVLEMPYMPKEDYAYWLLLTKSRLDAFNYGGQDSYYRLANNSLSSNKFKELYRQFVVLRKVADLSLLKTFSCLSTYVLNGLRKHKTYRAEN